MKTLKSILISLCILLIFSPAVILSEKNEAKIVVADFEVFLIQKDYGSLVSEIIISGLSSDGNLEIIERHRLTEILAEYELSQSGIINAEEAVKTGKLAGADQMIVGSVGKLGVEYVVNARIIDIESGKVIKGFSLSGTELNDISAMTSTMADLILNVLEGKKAVIPEKYISKSSPKLKSAENFTLTGYWMTEWYDGQGKHSGSMYLEQSGNSVAGWTVEPIGPAEIKAALNKNQLQGKYSAAYGYGEFEFTLSEDKNRLLGSYTASHGVHNTWNAWKFEIPDFRFKTGDKVFADWPQDIWSYHGTVREVSDDRCFIQYDDGDSGWAGRERIFPEKLQPGEVVYAAQENKKNYRYATVIKTRPSEVYVEYSDGTLKWESLGMLRILRVRRIGY
ncbi:MAG: hypothetical protein JW982_02715 [Spirochaetes bacterium]|nr:hypothetical protein [Spirochaetota bacterium]